MNFNLVDRAFLKKLLLLLCFFGAIVILTRLALQFESVANPTTVGFGFLIVVVISAVFGGLAVGVITSIIATLFFNYFFFPPIGTFVIAEFENWVALFAFLFTAIVISRLTASAHQNAQKCEVLDTTLGRLKEFSQWLLALPHDVISLTRIAEGAVEIFSLEYCSIHVYAEGKWHHFSGTSMVGELPKEIGDLLKRNEDHPTGLIELAEEQGLGVRYSRIQTGSDSFGLFVVKGKHLPMQAVDAIASMIGILLTEMLRAPQTER